MKRVFKKTSQIAFALLLAANVASAIDAEYKNSLTKVEFLKTGDSSYNINLYTQKSFVEPIKVIKKSDLNYYILLPETSNSSSASISSPDIRSVLTKVYPYAGADINNGYTKIDINTTRPINFTLSTKSATNQKTALVPQAKASSTPSIESKTAPEKKIEKKVEPKTVELKPQVKTETKTVEKKQAEPKEQVKIIKDEPKKIAPPVNNMPVFTPEPDKVLKEELSSNEAKNEQTVEETVEEETLVPKIVEQSSYDSDDYLTLAKNKLFSLKNKIAKKAKNYGLSLNDILLMALAALATFIVMLIVLSRKPSQAKLKNKADLIDKTEKQKPQQSVGQFVFDKSVQNKIHQNAQPKRHFALSNYDPKKNPNYEYQRADSDTEQESEIIQKILKEDSYSKISPEEFSTPYLKTPSNEPVVEKKVEVETSSKLENSSEPNVLSSIEIAPQRGFMCVSYNGNISFVGYILDDVFALYNFKQSKLDDYSIKFRLSEKTEHGANFIVKVDKTKLLIAVTRSSMTLEVAM